MNDFKLFSNKVFKEYSIFLDEKALDRLEKYARLLILWNEKMNLTAITDIQEIIIKHFLDSLTILSCVDASKDAKVIDVGTGAGFPGMPLKIARPDIKLTLLDSLNKRLIFLRELLNELELDAELIHSRAEEAAQNKKYREKFDIAVSRAVAPLNVLSEYCIPFVKIGGAFVAQKGPGLDIELENAKTAINILGGKIEKVDSFSLPGENARSVLVIKKVGVTPDKYPRYGSKISKKAL
ncbi:MAG: Ribosomal RNA small subunit methyltransferase G [Eubacteriales bacterium SKADARSKE-1]|nr:Ribosomal RNA small subunit methyltransferase G [Eubacteriales bacterium SKADARSKE-1]